MALLSFHDIRSSQLSINLNRSNKPPIHIPEEGSRQQGVFSEVALGWGLTGKPTLALFLGNSAQNVVQKTFQKLDEF